ncbi:MAG: phenylalanine--tRNA ligase subunit beta [Holosporales bacterium]|nr:phenylalanine--tRNA ligase subunit beta [Holosporales bacterium]
MKFSLNWLKDHLDTEANLGLITSTLTNIGLEVESVYNPKEAFKDIVVAYVESAEKHPQADRLKICKVNYGAEILQIVCGAPNARAGIYVALALPGAVIPNGNLTISKTKIRGAESMGMMCSARELMLGQDREGIIEIDKIDAASLGQPIADVLDIEAVIEVSLTPNRADCFAVRGIARDLAAAGIGNLKPLQASGAAEGEFDFPVKVSFDGDLMDESVPLLALQVIKGVKNVESPDWLKKKLRSAGLEPISALVDITNYFCLDMARPLHAYDVDCIEGDTVSIRLSKPGEEFKDLKGHATKLPKGIPVISDSAGILGVLGVMGGERSKVSDKTSTIMLESAVFDPIGVAQAGRQLNIVSEARTRFERGIDPEYTLAGLSDAANMVISICGGQLSNMYVRDVRKKIATEPVKLRLARLEQVSAMKITADKVREKLTALGLNLVSDSDNELAFSVPSWRHDISIEEDLIEEVLRLVGYESAPTVHLPYALSEDLGGTIAKEKKVISVKRTLCACGLDEVVTYAFTSREQNDLFCTESDHIVELANPISADLSVMRCSMLANLISACLKNKNTGKDNIALFEVGAVYKSLESQVLMAGGCMLDCAPIPHWSGNLEHDVFTLKSCIAAVIKSVCGIRENICVSSDAASWYHPGRSGKINVSKADVAWFGEIHPQTLKKMGVNGCKVLGFEIDLDALFALKIDSLGALSNKRLQSAVRDFAFVLDKTVPAGDILSAIKATSPNVIKKIGVFDVYEGDKVGEGKKSLAIRVSLEPTDATFTDEQLQDMSARIISEVNKHFGGVIRQ